uniref:Uncharacterized protein n=1 Tax=viral metagenome TaxID=1070528 RepID=A0A6C0BA26_9ZZZZ
MEINDMYDTDEDITIIPYIHEYNVIYTNTYLYDQIIHYMNNQLYYDTNQITNIQYYRILDFLHQFL